MNWWHYLLLVNIYLVLFYGFYVLLLRKETFFQLNRVYLVAAALLSFFIPVIQSDWVQHLFITEQVRYSIYGGTINIYAYQPVESSPVTIGQVLTVLYLGGIAFLTGRLILQLVRVNKLIHTPNPSDAYSFFKKISLGEDLAKEDAVLAHEQVHARQWHSVDTLLIEAVMIINWFNPVVYLYRFAIKHIHEFIADQQALKIGTDKTEYALLLLSQTFSMPSHQLVSPFFTHSLLKKRIMMIQKNKSHCIVLFKYVLSAPLFGLMLILSSATINNSKAVNTIRDKASDVFETPAGGPITNVIDNGKIPDEITAQKDTSHKIYTSVEKDPSYPGGMEKFYAFLGKTAKYPADARRQNIQGKVFVQFVVEKDGSLTNVKSTRGPGHGLDEEAVRAVKASGKWKPATQGGKIVRAQYTVPVNFTLSDGDIVSRAPQPARPMPPTPKKDQLVKGENGVYSTVETNPEYPGGMQGFYDFLSRTVKYPAIDRQNNITGKVFITFIVEKDGSLTDIKAERGPSATTKAEAVRATSLSQKWIPGKLKDGTIVRVQYTVPVNFTLSDGTTITRVPRPSPPTLKDDKPKDENSVYSSVEKDPAFPGGMQAFYDFLTHTVKYPAIDRQNNITGKVFITFIIEKDGSLTDIKAARGPSATINAEAVRAVSLSPKWIPAMQDGKVVRIQYTVPVNFTLNSDDNKVNGMDVKGGTIRLRGSYGQSNGQSTEPPLIIVDGVEYTKTLNTIDPNSIKNVEILKDEAAKRIYGKKGDHGVLLITTHKAEQPPIKK